MVCSDKMADVCVGIESNVPDLWAYFLLDQILPVSFTQNLFCAALTRIAHVTQDHHRTEPARYFINCLRLAGLLCYLVVLYWTPSTVKTAWFFPTLFTLRVLLFTPYIVDILALQLSPSTSSKSSPTTTKFNQGLLAVLMLAFGSIGSPKREASDVAVTPSSDTSYAAAALSNDMAIGILGGIALFFLHRR